MNQRMEALKLANVEREAKKIVKQRIRSGDADPVRVILMTERAFTVAELLKTIPKIGKVKADKIAKAASVHPTARIRDLHEIQRERLAVIVGQMLEGMADKRVYQRRWREGRVAA